MTFSSLKTQIANTLKRDDLTSRIPEFIENGEFFIANDVRPRGFEVYVSSTFTAGSGGAIITLPVRFKEMIAFHVLSNAAGTATGTVRSTIQRRPYSYVRWYGRDQTSTGLPKYWAGMGQDNALVALSPSVAFVFNMAYYERLAPLSNANTTNWLTDQAPNLLLYGALVQAAPYLREDPRIATWKSLYEDAKSGVNASSFANKTAEADAASGGM